MEELSNVIRRIDDIVWGPAMLALFMGTGIYLTIRLRFLPWRNLGYALKLSFSKEMRVDEGAGDISAFSALTTALAATIGTGNIVGVATAMAAGGPGALVWMWISACFGLSSKFAECVLAIKYREVNAKGEMSGGPMYTMKKAFKNKKLGAAMGWLFALLAVIASFGVGNMTQANSISEAMYSTFRISPVVCGIVITLLAFAIIVGGIKKISSVSAIVVPCMALFYIGAGILVIVLNYRNLPEGVAMIFRMAFSMEAVGGGLCGNITASMMQALHYGVARGTFSNEAGMGSAAISAAAAVTDSPVKQGYVNMTGTFWDTIVVCTITGLCIASSGVLGMTELHTAGRYVLEGDQLSVRSVNNKNEQEQRQYRITYNQDAVILSDTSKREEIMLYPLEKESTGFAGEYTDEAGNRYSFQENGIYEYSTVVKGATLTIVAFQSVLGDGGGYVLCIGIVLFAFATILGWEYQGEKAFEYMLGTYKYNMLYRILYSLLVYVGATTALDLVWDFSDIANALMAVPNLICLLALSGVVAKEIVKFRK